MVNLTRQIHEGIYLNWFYQTILRQSHLFQIGWVFTLFHKSIFKTTFYFISIQHLKHILALSVHRMKLLLYIKTKSGNHVILEIKLSSSSKFSNGNDFIVLFKIGFSRFINKLSLRSNLNLLQSVAKMVKSSKFMAQLHCNRWADITDCLTHFRRFTVRLEMCSAALI